MSVACMVKYMFNESQLTFLSTFDILSSFVNFLPDIYHRHTMLAHEGRVWDVFSLKARFMGPTRGPPGADRTQVGPMLAT